MENTTNNTMQWDGEHRGALDIMAWCGIDGTYVDPPEGPEFRLLIIDDVTLRPGDTLVLDDDRKIVGSFGTNDDTVSDEEAD